MQRKKTKRKKAAKVLAEFEQEWRREIAEKAEMAKRIEIEKAVEELAKWEQGTVELGANTVLKQTNELCF